MALSNSSTNFPTRADSRVNFVQHETFIRIYCIFFASMSSKASASQDDDVDDLDGTTLWIIK